MRLLKRLQRSLREARVEFGTGDELDEMSRILESTPEIGKVYEAILKDVNGKIGSRKGRDGLSAEQIVKLGILRKRLGLTYRGLSEASADSLSMRRFLDLPFGEKLSRSAIHSNLKAISDSTWELLHQSLTKYALGEGYENGKSIRSDCTTVETNIHYPTDASLSNDCVRVLTRAMELAHDVLGEEVVYIDHRRRSKSRLYKINNIRSNERRHPHYLDLIRLLRKTIAHAQEVQLVVAKAQCADLSQMLKIMNAEADLKTYIPRAENVLDQAYRRVVKKEEVPAQEKIFSIFEEHTDIIVKGFRDVVFGHKVRLTTGQSCLMLQLEILDGNPKDSTLVPDILQDHTDVFKSAPEQAAFDGCFASFDNRDLLKEAGVKELTFSKNLSMSLESLVSSKAKHRKLLRFRAGVEGCISFLKLIFSFSRVLDRSKETFKAALHLGAAAYNLTLLARYNIARAAT